jgi:hypothetical protein
MDSTTATAPTDTVEELKGCREMDDFLDVLDRWMESLPQRKPNAHSPIV